MVFGMRMLQRSPAAKNADAFPLHLACLTASSPDDRHGLDFPKVHNILNLQHQTADASTWFLHCELFELAPEAVLLSGMICRFKHV